jgi:Tol biopolymer transport system component
MDPPGGSPNIATINPDGSGFKQLTFSNGPQSASLQPAYSPDGTKIIFSRFRSTGGTDLFTMNPDGSGTSQNTSAPSLDLYPEWAVAP